MSPVEALRLVQLLLEAALAERPVSTTYVRDLAGQIGDLRATMRAALTVIEGAEK
ncbi:hypothetical protein ABZT16_23815 [Streptomyces flaveolus]|uniref:hypothetical protein n=1 Tax=Streptomyces flaveolus TaxID=67297 RepID=UPI0033A2C3C8